MPHPIRTLVLTGSLLAMAAGLAACGSSGGSDAAPSTTKAEASTTTEATTTTTTADGTTTTEADTTTTEAGPTTTLVAGEPVDCQALLQEYAEVFDPDDLSEVVTFFRTYEPAMPTDVAEATERLAVAYDEAGDLGNLNMGDVDLTADAQTFSDWTNDGCPAG